MTLLVRGKISPEKRNLVNRFLIWIYQPSLVNFVLRFRWLTIFAALAILAVTIYPYETWH